jgi:hypothetical protein
MADRSPPSQGNALLTIIMPSTKILVKSGSDAVRMWQRLMTQLWKG